MRKVLIGMLSVALVVGVWLGWTGEGAEAVDGRPYSENVRVTLDGELVVFEEQGPIILDGSTMVPVRGLFEKLGYEVLWDPENREVRLNGDLIEGTNIRFSVSLIVGNPRIMGTFGLEGGNRTVTSPVAPFIFNNRTMLPLRALIEIMPNAEIEWDGDTRTVIIRTVTQSTEPVDERDRERESLMRVTGRAVYFFDELNSIECIDSKGHFLSVTRDGQNMILAHRRVVVPYGVDSGRSHTDIDSSADAYVNMNIDSLADRVWVSITDLGFSVDDLLLYSDIYHYDVSRLCE